MKPGALLLLLAAAASQVDLSQSVTFDDKGGTMDISSCPITYYGKTFPWIKVVILINDNVAVSFLKTENEDPSDLLTLYNTETINNVDVTIQAATTAPGSDLHTALTDITSTSTCYVSLALKMDSTKQMNLFIYNFGKQAAFKLLTFPSYTLYTYVEGSIGDSYPLAVLFPNAETSAGVFKDISGCRVSDVALEAGSSKVDPSNCTSEVCSPSADLTSASTCELLDKCLGQNICQSPAVCTVIGSSVIDFNNNVISIEDRCDYTLVELPGDDFFQIDARFKERLRKDVSFLDQLTIKLTAGTIVLEQGGRVVVEGQPLNLNATTQEVFGVTLSKDQTGVTAELPIYSMKVFFDGNTAHVSGILMYLEGLCGDPINGSRIFTTTEMKTSSSAAGCDIQHNDNIDVTINCNSSSEHCDLLKQEPFSACHNHTDPEPFVDACTDTLCRYPAVDGVDCQFMEAYAESCRLKTNITLSDWRSEVNCSPAPPTSCLDQYCSGHEFCGENLGETSCLCRALFASKYTPTNALGEPTVCTEDSATVTLAECLLQGKGIDSSDLHLNDPSCKGLMDLQTHMVTFSFDSSNACGTEVLMNNDQILYKNAIVMKNASENGIITHEDQVQIDFSCVYVKPDIRSVSFRIKDSSVVQEIESGIWNYTLMMSAYADAGRMNLIHQDTPVQLNQKVWVELKTEGLDEDMSSIVTDACWATNEPLANGSLRYDLIKDGCPNKDDGTVNMEGNGLGTSNFFSFNMFAFSGQQSEIYLHCQLELCPKKESCARTCNGPKRRRRSSRSDSAEGNPALMTMAWSH